MRYAGTTVRYTDRPEAQNKTKKPVTNTQSDLRLVSTVSILNEVTYVENKDTVVR